MQLWNSHCFCAKFVPIKPDHSNVHWKHQERASRAKTNSFRKLNKYLQKCHALFPNCTFALFSTTTGYFIIHNNYDQRIHFNLPNIKSCPMYLYLNSTAKLLALLLCRRCRILTTIQEKFYLLYSIVWKLSFKRYQYISGKWTIIAIWFLQNCARY